MGIAYFGIDSLPATLGEIPLEYFERALAWLVRQPEVQPGRLAVLGISRGSEMALQLGATFPAIRAVVADEMATKPAERRRSSWEGRW